MALYGVMDGVGQGETGKGGMGYGEMGKDRTEWEGK